MNASFHRFGGRPSEGNHQTISKGHWTAFQMRSSKLFETVLYKYVFIPVMSEVSYNGFDVSPLRFRFMSMKQEAELDEDMLQWVVTKIRV